MELANIVTVARVLRDGSAIKSEVVSDRHVYLGPKGAGYVLRRKKFCPIIAISGDGKSVTIETVKGTLPKTASLARAGQPKAAAPAKDAAPAKPVRGAAANAPAKGSPEAKAKMAELRAKRDAKPAAPKATLDAIASALAGVATTQAKLAERMDAQEVAMAAFIAKFAR